MTSEMEHLAREKSIRSLVGCQVVRQHIPIFQGGLQVALVSASTLDPRSKMIEVRFCDCALKTVVDGESMDICDFIEKFGFDNARMGAFNFRGIVVTEVKFVHESTSRSYESNWNGRLNMKFEWERETKKHIVEIDTSFGKLMWYGRQNILNSSEKIDTV